MSRVRVSFPAPTKNPRRFILNNSLLCTFSFGNAYNKATIDINNRRYSQVVRQRSAKPSLPSSNLGGTSMIAEHYRWNGKKASRLKVFGNFLFSKFLGNSIDEIVACRGSNRVWTSVFPYSSGISVTAPFFRGLRRLDFRKIGEKSFTKLWALDCWFSRTNDQRQSDGY